MKKFIKLALYFLMLNTNNLSFAMNTMPFSLSQTSRTQESLEVLIVPITDGPLKESDNQSSIDIEEMNYMRALRDRLYGRLCTEETSKKKEYLDSELKNYELEFLYTFKDYIECNLINSELLSAIDTDICNYLIGLIKQKEVALELIERKKTAVYLTMLARAKYENISR